MKRTMLATIAAISSIGVVSLVHAAGDVQAGKVLSAACAPCHGANGGGMAQYPPLVGEKADQLIQALRDFKSGKRDNVFMKGMASSLSDQDIENVAAYYASLK